jgi:membrane fusion protein (multidrug efflux system)
MPRKRSNHLALLVLLLALPLAGCFDRGAESAVAAPAPTAHAAPGPASGGMGAEGGFSVSGPLIVEHQLDVLAQRDGVITKLVHDAGSRVRTGDLLAQFDDRQLDAELQAARAKTLSTEADLNNWKAEAKVLDSDYQRARKLWEAQVLTQEQLEHAKFKAEADLWDVKRVEQLLVNAKETEHSLELELEKTQIRAPFSGIVARRYVREGQQIAKGDRLFWVTAEGPLRMRFTLPQKYISQIRNGQQFSLTIPDLPDQIHQARVVEVSPVVDASSGTFEVMVQLEGTPGALRPGMDASVRIENMR